jgi:hypothetical protein
VFLIMMENHGYSQIKDVDVMSDLFGGRRGWC